MGKLKSAFFVILLGIASFAVAVPITVSNYSMANGGTGTYNYRDFPYSNCVGNSCNTSYSALSGGTGKLTDGVLPADSWNEYGMNTPWVGWWSSPFPRNPSIDFYFANTVNIDSVTVWVDNSLGAGNVRLPTSVIINGTTFLIQNDTNTDPRAYTFSGLGITGNSVNVQFTYRDLWLMVGEVSFDDGVVVGLPEPTPLALLGAAVVSLMLLRRQKCRNI